VLAILLRAPYAGVPLGVDEGGYAYVARAWSGLAGPSLYGHYWVDRPPLLLLAFRAAVTGGAVGIRVLGALAALGLVAAVYALARAACGPRVAAVAGLLAAVLSGSAAIDAVYTPGELLAAVPSTLSVTALVLAHRRSAPKWLVPAGVLAVAALLIKQSSIDAVLAGVVFVAWAARSRERRTWPRPFALGVLLALGALGAWMALAGVGAGALADALLGFRIHALSILSSSNLPLLERLGHLDRPALASGLALLLPLAVAGLMRLRGERLIALTLGAWLLAAVAGVLGGGSYWSHYLIEIVPGCAVGSAVVLARVRARPRRILTTAIAGVALLGAAAGGVAVTRHPPHEPAAAVGRWIGAHARPGDTQYVIYARADVAYYDRLPTPYPYAWSLMLRARPDAMPRLRALLRSSARPTWVVAWQPTNDWGLDPRHELARLVREDYRRVATVDGHAILHRRPTVVRA
jgi:4-amino-4-deoxy-L-arabinose transferase-like glycosyltransferase